MSEARRQIFQLILERDDIPVAARLDLIDGVCRMFDDVWVAISLDVASEQLSQKESKPPPHQELAKEYLKRYQKNTESAAAAAAPATVGES